GIRSDLQFNFGTLTPGTTLAPLNVTGAATFTTTPTNITITGSSLPTSSGNGYPLMTWGSGGLASTNGIALTLPLRVSGNLAIVGSTLYLKVTGTTAPLAWAGGNGTWDVNNSGNLIWKDNASASAYYQETAGSSDTVVFNNTVGSGGVVTNNTTVSPASVTVTNPTADYTFSGSGGIAGSTGLTKSGAGKLTLTTANSYTGATTVNGGTLALTNNGALPLATAITINGGTLDLGSQTVVNNQGNNTGVIFGSNGGTLNGTGTNIIIGADGNAVTFNVAAGAAAVINENIVFTNLTQAYQALGSVGAGATLTINGQVINTKPGSNPWLQGGGTLVLNNASNVFTTLGIWNTGGTVIITNFGALGSGGYMTMGQGPANGPAALIYMGPTASTVMQFPSADLTQTILNNGSGTVTFTNTSFTSPYGVPVSATPQTLTLGGSADINIFGIIQDANNKGTNGFNSNLVKTNSDTLTLYGNNTYHGTTTVKAGTLFGVTGGSCSNSAVTL
ncbi:MAG: autotransporter-associated beta strand repeat-containing protein, partial [Verrucomicrobiota bacterium]